MKLHEKFSIYGEKRYDESLLSESDNTMRDGLIRSQVIMINMPHTTERKNQEKSRN